MLAVESLMIARILEQTTGFTTVGNSSALAQGMRRLGELLPACFIFPGPSVPELGEHDLSCDLPLLEYQHWDVVVIVPHENQQSTSGQTDNLAGDLLNQVLKALHGWSPSPTNPSLLQYMGREQPKFSMGYAEFTLTFAGRQLVGI